MSKHYETSILETPFVKPDAYGALNFPVYYSAAYGFDTAKATSDAFAGRTMEHAYSRISNPTTQYLERRVQRWTGALSVTALDTGMAAISYALTALAGKDVNIVASKHLFGNSVSFLRDTLGSFGVETRFVDTRDLQEVEAAIDDHTGGLFFEVITNPQLYVADIQGLADIAHRHGVPLLADTTVVPFSTFHAKDFGVDIELVSSTKYISGGATGLGGLILDYGTFDYTQSPNPVLQKLTKRACQDGAHHQPRGSHGAAGRLYGDPGPGDAAAALPPSGGNDAVARQTVSADSGDQTGQLYRSGGQSLL